ncbi:MAG TPA: sensor histidine kinase [Cyanobacteria bacterium UBA11371]|nr:sensor histidine kinase [Cyanobacteria bacterium UBA11371]
MLMPASSEFVALCQAQVKVIQKLGATLSAVYLTEELAEDSEANLIPVVAYPSPDMVWEEQQDRALLPQETDTTSPVPWLPSAADTFIALDGEFEGSESSPPHSEVKTLLKQRRIVLPLMHEGLVMGLLVTERQDRPWNQRERSQIEDIAHTMAIACILDQRRAWFEQQLTQQHQLQEQQNDLFHNLLHQLRNPLTALRTFGKLLLKRLGISDPNGDIAANILRESDRIQELLQQFDRVLELAETRKVPLTLPSAHLSVDTETDNNQQSSTKPLLLLPGSGLIASTLKPLSVTQVLEPLLASARAIAAERHLDLQAQIPSNLPPVLANDSALREILSNLIDNALKYTPAGGKVYIQVGQERKTPQGRFLGIAVSDTGPGIPAQDLPHLFERRYRGVQAETEIPGTGLGLAIAKELVEQMQGEIQVISPAQHPDAGGSGVTFVVWLMVAI